MLKQGKFMFTEKRVANIYVVYETNLWPFKESTDFTLVNFLLGTVKVRKNSDFEKYKYYGCGFVIWACW